MGLISQSTRYMHRVIPDVKPGDKLDEHVATFGEAAVARVMHRLLGLNGKLPKSAQDNAAPKTQNERICEYLRENPGSRMRDMAAALKIPPHRMSNNLGALRRRGVVDRWYEHDPMGGKFTWARWRLK